MRCVSSCPSNALITFGYEISVEDLMKEILIDKSFYDFSGGGVTLSGGEPTLQMDFLEEILSRCRDDKIHTAIETCGFFDYEEFKRVMNLIDLIIFDVKVFDKKRHKAFTGVSNDKILKNLRAISKNHRNIWIRVPLIPGVNTDKSEIINISELINSFDNIKRVEILPYHSLGISKYETLGIECGFTKPAKLFREEMDRALQLFKKNIGNLLYLNGEK